MGPHNLLGDAWGAESDGSAATVDPSRYYTTAPGAASASSESTLAKWAPLVLAVLAVAIVANAFED